MSRFSRFNKFQLVYWIIAVATATHTAWGAATTMQGAQPNATGLQLSWWLQGFAFAIAIDISMVMVATKIRSGTSAAQHLGVGRLRIPINWYTITFATVAITSFYFQLVYAWAHADALPHLGGVADEWIARLQGVINARIVIAPAALPIIATLYTLGGFGKGGEAQSKRNIASNLHPQRPQPDPIKIERVADELPRLPQAQARNLLPSPQMIREDGKLVAYICPGCQKQLSISGWSRHKNSCVELQALVNKDMD